MASSWYDDLYDKASSLINKADANEFLINKDGKWHSIPRSFKKLIAKNIFDQKLLKKYKKANKLNLKKKESLIELVSYFNSI